VLSWWRRIYTNGASSWKDANLNHLASWNPKTHTLSHFIFSLFFTLTLSISSSACRIHREKGARGGK
jgi:hypothetical protein